jgi:AraC-like DNA-binding protein
MIAPAQMALGMYDEALATYTEIERRMAADTLNEDYAVILRSRAIAARTKGRLAEAYDYQARYAALSKAVSDSLHKSEAHDYAARYRAQEQQLQIQEKQAEAERSHIVSLAIAVVALLAVAFALYFFRQKRIVSEKNRALVRMISGMPPEPDDEAETVEESREVQNADEAVEDSATDDNADADFFSTIDATIRSERLYSDLTLQRQDICDRFGIRRHTLNNLLSAYSHGQTFPQYVNSLRMEEAVILLRDHPEMTLADIAATVGFTPANLREKFKRQYGMTPAEYQKQREKMS